MRFIINETAARKLQELFGESFIGQSFRVAFDENYKGGFWFLYLPNISAFADFINSGLFESIEIFHVDKDPVFQITFK